MGLCSHLRVRVCNCVQITFHFLPIVAVYSFPLSSLRADQLVLLDHYQHFQLLVYRACSRCCLSSVLPVAEGSSMDVASRSVLCVCVSSNRLRMYYCEYVSIVVCVDTVK
jgi:hypothetical protein